MEAMGLRLFVPAEYRLHSVVAFHRPTGVDATRLKQRMVDQFGVEIAGAFGLDILRVGQMGEQCRSHNLFHTLYALGESTRLEGFPCDVSAGMATLERTLVAHSERPASDNGDGRAAPRP
jgi:aspartate aminotransferase-like enzyme